MRHRSIALTGLVPACLLVFAGIARAETTATLADGQHITGNVPPGEVIRLHFPLPVGAQPHLTFAVKGSPVTLSFKRSDIYDPDGNLIPDTGRFFAQKLRRGKSTLKLRDFVAAKSGMYQLVIETNSQNIPRLAMLRAAGKLKIKRDTKIRVDLDENDLRLGTGLLVGDRIRVKVKRLTGGMPTIAAYVTPAGELRPPPQKTTRNGAKTSYFRATRDAEHGFEFSYLPGSTEGDFRVTLQVRPLRSPGTAVMRLANAPGVPISVRDADRSTTLSFGSGAPGVAYDGSVFLISARRTGAAPDVAARFFNRELFSLPGTPTPVVLAGQADVGPLETIAGHRLVYAGNQYAVAFWTVSGSSAWLATFDRNFRADAGLASKTGFAPVTTSAVTPIVNPFLTTDGDRLSFGVFVSPAGHDVHVYEADLQAVGTIEIGGGAYGHGAGAGVAWHVDDEFFEFWAPDTTSPTLPSDLHRQRYTALWQPQGPDERPVADAAVTETMSTAVVHDPETDATIVHYVVPVNPVTGDGTIHRVIFDANGDLVPGSDVALPGSDRNRPTAVIVGGSLYLGSSRTDGPPLIERYPLLR